MAASSSTSALRPTAASSNHPITNTGAPTAPRENLMTERSIRDQLSASEAALIYNALLEKAQGDRKAGESVEHPKALRDTLMSQADMAERLAEEFL